MSASTSILAASLFILTTGRHHRHSLPLPPEPPRCEIIVNPTIGFVAVTDGMCECLVPHMAESIVKYTITVLATDYSKEWVRFLLNGRVENLNQPVDGVYGYMRLKLDKKKHPRWTFVVFGSAIDDETEDEYHIPMEVRYPPQRPAAAGGK